MVTNKQSEAAFRALADTSRREILATLQKGESTVVELASGFAMSRPAVSKHLRVLREAGLVVERPSGRERIYTLVADSLDPVAAWLQSMGNGTVAGAGARSRGGNGTASGRSALRVRRSPAQPRDDSDWRVW